MLFVPLIVVLALVVSGSVFQSTCWNHAALGLPETVHSVQQARRPLTVAGLLIVTAFLPLLASSQVPVRRLGMHLVAGSLLAIGLLFYVVPALLAAGSRRPLSDDDTHRWRGLATLLSRSPRLIAAGSLVLLIAGAAGLSRFRSETSLLRDLESDSPVAQDASFLDGMLTGTTPVEMIVRFTPEAQRQQRFIDRLEIVRNVEEQVRQHPAVTGALSQADFLPVQQPLAADAPTRERVLYNRRSNELERRVKGDANLTECGFLRTASHSRGAIGSQADAGAVGDELWRISVWAVLSDRLDAGQLAAELGGGIRSGLRYYPGADHCLAAPALLAHRSQHALLRSLLWRLGMAGGIAGIVLLCWLRSARATGWAMLPLLLPALSVFGFGCWRGQPIDAEIVLTASVALVLGMFHAAHLLSRFRDGLDCGGSRAQSLRGALQFCGPSVWQSSVILGGGLLVLSAAPWLPLSRCGATAVAMLAATVFSQMVFLPALLAGPLGAALERTLAARRVREESTQVTGSVPGPHVRLTTHLQRDVARHAG
jgi:predicted RND superfamily exporter protein